MTPPGSLRTLVLARRRRWLAARGVESALVACAVVAVTLAAARLSGADLSPSAGLVAGLCGLLGGASLLRERWRSEVQFTRRFDARVGADGAIVTACQAARSAPDDALVRLLAQRTLAGLDAARLARASAPPSPLSAAVCLAGLAVLAWVADLRGDSGHARLWAALAAVEASAPAAAPGAAPELEQALGALASARAGAGLAAAEERELERRLEAALETVRASAAGPRGLPGGPLASPGSGDAAGDVSRPAPPGTVAGGGAGDGSGEPTLAAGPAVSTMLRPRSSESMPTSPPDQPRETPGAAAGPGGSPAAPAGPRGRFWPRRHDAVVAGYIEHSPRD